MRLRPAIPALALASVFAAAPAQEPVGGAAPAAEAAPAATAPDLSAWTCRFCTFEDGGQGWVEPVIGHVSDDSFRFGDYTGMQERGWLADLSGAWSYRGQESADALDLRVERLGLDSRALGISGGRQGSYRAWLNYEALPHLLAKDSRTPFAGASGNLALPGSWSPGGSTGSMAALDASLRAKPLQQERERTALGLALTPHRLADLRFDYRRDEIRGTGATGASFMTLASQLPQPIDQIHDRVDASLAVRHALGHAQFALESSFFSNRVDALAWQNPYNPPAPGATAGQMALAPDNNAHRLIVKVGTAPGSQMQVAGQFARGRLRQNQRFLPATVNPDEAVALPRASLDAQVDTTLTSVRASYGLGRMLRLTADVLRDDRDNRTPVDAYTQVVMDTFTGTVRTNAPYGFTRNRWRFSAEHRASPRLAVGVDDDRRERRLHGVGETTERRYWGRMGWRPFEGADVRLRLAHARREGQEFTVDPGAPAQNPRLRAYNTAERRRDEASADFSLGGPLLTNTFNLTTARDEYPATVIGRTSGREFGYGSDLILQPTDKVALSAFASHRRQETGQSGSQAFGPPDWFADQEDITNVLGIHLSWQAPRGVELGADYVLSTSEGSIAMLAGGSENGFPLLLTRWHDARLFGRYPLRPDLSLRLDLLRAVYTARDWALDALEPDTVPNLLALGQGTQEGSVTAVLLGLRYQFGAAAPARD